MHTYSVSCHCTPSPHHENARQYAGMLADVVVVMPTEGDAKRVVQGYLQDQGWLVEEWSHIEALLEAPLHDARLGLLYQTAKRKGLAAELSPYR